MILPKNVSLRFIIIKIEMEAFGIMNSVRRAENNHLGKR